MAKMIDGQNFFERIMDKLDEKPRRLVAGAAALSIGRGGIAAVARMGGISRPTIYSGIKDIEERDLAKETPGKKRQRRAGGGRKNIENLDPELPKILDELIKPYEHGDPESPLRWSSKSLRRLSEELKNRSHNVSHVTVGRILEGLGYRLQSNKKLHETGSSPDRDAQFEHINNTTREFNEDEQPVISVDAKKKELVGNFKNNGREYRISSQPEEVNIYDFIDPSLGRATPYGVYDVNANEGYVGVGTSHDTAKFAVETIENWWLTMGRHRYPEAHSLFITADGGSRNRLWKVRLQKFADKFGLNVFVSHFPPGTSKWNKIEHRMFSAISMNWRGKPLSSLEVIVNLIASTTTNTGLKIKSAITTAKYELGEKVSDNEMGKLNTLRHEFHPEWNYMIKHQDL